METKKEFILALLKVQKELPIVPKNSEGDTGNRKYSYAKIEKVWETCGKIINDNGFVITNEISKEGVKTTAHHEHGELSSFFSFTAEAIKPQKIGSETTYARRYNLTAIFGIICAGEDDDGQEAMKATEKLSTKKGNGVTERNDAPILD